jgi:hypothetical protein
MKKVLILSFLTVIAFSSCVSGTTDTSVSTEDTTTVVVIDTLKTDTTVVSTTTLTVDSIVK